MHRGRQRPRHPDRHPQGRRHFGGRGHHDPAACRRKIRPEFLQGVRRPARRRRLGGQRAVELAQAHHLARRQRAFHGIRRRRRGGAAEGRRRRRRQARHGSDVLAFAEDLHHGGVRLRHARAPPARTGVPQFRRHHRAVRHAPRGREARGDEIRRRRRGLREISRPQQDAADPQPDHDQGRARRHHGGSRAVVERRLSRERALLHQQHSAARRRHASGRLPRRAHPPDHAIRRDARHHAQGKGGAHRRRLPRGPDLGALGQGAGPEILLADQGQAGVLGSPPGGRERDQPGAAGLVRNSPRGSHASSSARWWKPPPRARPRARRAI